MPRETAQQATAVAPEVSERMIRWAAIVGMLGWFDGADPPQTGRRTSNALSQQRSVRRLPRCRDDPAHPGTLAQPPDQRPKDDCAEHAHGQPIP